MLYKGNNVEFIGRGTSHQIDLPYEFNYFIPFVNPSQVIGEAKYYDNAIYKHIIRSFIGVITDIESNYVVSHLPNVCGLKERRLTQTLFISATGFHAEAEKLAYAHNIKLITFRGNPIFDSVLEFIDKEAELTTDLS